MSNIFSVGRNTLALSLLDETLANINRACNLIISTASQFQYFTSKIKPEETTYIGYRSKLILGTLNKIKSFNYLKANSVNCKLILGLEGHVFNNSNIICDGYKLLFVFNLKLCC